MEALAFWAVTFVVGIIALPVTTLLFGRLPGRGLTLARPFGTLLVTYPIWLGASTGALSYGTVAAILGMLVVASAAAGLLLFRTKPAAESDASPRSALRVRLLALVTRPEVRLWLMGEVLFTTAFFGWALLRSYAPEVWGTERPMDMAFVSSLGRSSSFPPPDPWMVGESLNYYYYGHFVVSFFTRLTGIRPELGYNLGLSFFFAITCTTVFAVASEMYLALRRRSKDRIRVVALVGIGTTVLTVMLGNLAGAGQLLEGNLGKTFDWWTASRVVEGGATEFPFFSYLLGDLHAHVLVVPFTLLALAFALQIAIAGPSLLDARPKPEAQGQGLSGLVAGWRSWGPGIVEIALASIVFGSLLATNTLDMPTASVILLGAVFISAHSRGTSPVRSGAWGVAVLLAALIAWAPFLTTYRTSAEGIGVIIPTKSFIPFFIDVFVVYGLMAWLLLPRFRDGVRTVLGDLSPGLVAFLALLVVVLASLLGLPGFLLLGLLAITGYSAAKKIEPAERFVWLLLSAGLGILALTGFVYIRDAFAGSPDYRFNTIFKFGYQAWFLLAIPAGVVFATTQGKGIGRRIWIGGAAVLVIAAATYPALAPYSRTNGFAGPQTLDGLRWLRDKEPSDVAAIEWLRENAGEAEPILEAVGPDYSPEGHARVSTFTGLPTVMGWIGHEIQWDHDPATREADVTMIYNTLDTKRARELLERYGIVYVFVGSLERRGYSPTGLAKFEKLGEEVFQQGKTVVYRVG